MYVHEYYTVVLAPGDPNVETCRMWVCVRACVRVYCTFVLVPAVSVETRIIYVGVYVRMHVCVYVYICLFVFTYVCNTVVIVTGNPVCSDVT